MKIIIKIFILIFIPLGIFAQDYGNEWINYDQKYYRVNVPNDGIYRISYQSLVDNGFPANEIDPRWIQVFHNGEEQYIYIEGEGNNGIFDPSGYIEFYGERNDGNTDKFLYTDPEDYINPDHSIFTDTSAYFITWNSSINNRRLQVETDNSFGSYSSFLSNYCIKHLRYNYTGHYNAASSRPSYTRGEAWVDADLISDDESVSKNISLNQLKSQGGQVEIELAVTGAPASDIVSYVPHHLKAYLQGNLIIDSIYYGYDFVKYSESFNASQLSENLSFNFSSNDVQSPNLNDYNRLSYIDIKYPRKYHFGSTDSFNFILPSGSGSKDYLEISNLNTSGNIWLYDINQNLRIKVYNQAGTLKALVPNPGTQRTMHIANNDGIIEITDIKPVSDNAKFTDYMSLNPDPDYLIITHPGLMNGAGDYKNYRNSTGYNAEIFDINQLYDQYAYGIRKNPYCIRNLVREYFDNNGEAPDYLFLMGKGIQTATIRNSPGFYKSCLIPTFGKPASDVLITAGLDNTVFEPLVPTGRLAARSTGQVSYYLDKITAYESNEPGKWMKNIMHFGGGANESEQNSFAAYLAGYESIIEDTLYGGFVHTFLKNSSDPIQITVSDSVRNLINSGVTMMNFFGHATASGFDQNIDDPENYSNQDKYPFILANSCFSGDIHITNNQSTSEDWVLIANRGAIGFLATVSTGIPAYLNIFSENFYEAVSYSHYGEPVGKQQQEAIIEAQTGSTNDLRVESVCHEMTLHGDPALVLNSFDYPDLMLNSSDIYFNDTEITTLQDSFRVNVHINNIGRASLDTFQVKLTRYFPDESFIEYDTFVDGCLYENEFSIKLPVEAGKSPGLNRIVVRLDIYDQIQELSENNNDASIEFLIKSGSVYPVYPYEYAIYPNSGVDLKASTSNPFIEERNYLFNLDTTDMFDSNSGSPLYSGMVNESGGVISWTAPLSLTENTVYYWRVGAEHPIPDSIEWNESSFIYIDGEEGWSQAHFYQFKKDEFGFIDYDRTEKDFDFIETAKELQCHNIGSVGSWGYEDVRFSIDGSIGDGLGDGGSCLNSSGMHIVIIDPVTLKAWPSNIADYGQTNYPMCSGMGRPNYFLKFLSGSNESRDNMADLLENNVPDGYYVLAYSFISGNFQNWSENQYQAFENLGASNIRLVENNYPYVFFAKKGDPSFSENQEIIGQSSTDVIDLYATLNTAFNYGTISSTIIGPATEWNSLEWYQESLESNNDSSFLEIQTYNIADFTGTAIDTLFAGDYNIPDMQSLIDAQNNPYLKLNFWTRDDSTKTPGQLKKWQIKHAGIPETAINPKSGFFITGDSIKRGEELVFSVATENISPYDMDSLLVRYWIQTSQNEIINIETKKLRPHPSGDIIVDTTRFNSLELSGRNSIWVEFNPINTGGTYDQPEKYHFNNIAQYYFSVSVDNENPLLDVTFDGVHILDGDIVSAKPEILISLKDENPYLPLNDTSLFRIYLTNLQNGNEKRIYFTDSLGNPNLEWTPGSPPENKFKILYKPEFIDNGTYQLRIQATDVSGNESGDYDYSINFEVITESTISHVLNYPNPFSTSTRFVFELTGSIVPDKFRIEIYTVTGRLVKVIDKTVLGSLHIGRNITDYAWDGTDMYGDKLANGVYFYRIKTEISGESIDHRSNESDKYFDKNIGKMYILR